MIKMLLFCHIVCIGTSIVAWYETLPEIGLVLPPYSLSRFIHHAYTLHELAPQKGKSIRICLIDTGIIPENFEKKYNNTWGCLDVTSELYEKLEQFHLICKNILKHPPSLLEIHEWLSTYVSSGHMPQELTVLSDQQFLQNLLLSIAQKADTITLPSGQTVIKDYLPYQTHATESTQRIQSHGTFMYDLLTSFVPEAEIIVIKAFDELCIGKKSYLIKALELAHELQPQVVVICFKLEDSTLPFTPLSRTIHHLLGKFPYVIASSGNGNFEFHKLAYPARFSTVTFSIGAFGVDHGVKYIPYFSQFEPGKGPSFVAPGVAIQSPTCSEQLLSGTSPATAIFSGFLALLLSEFGPFFSKNEIIKIITLCSTKMPQSEWKMKTLYGYIDMRLCLCTLHVLKSLILEKPYIISHLSIWVKKIKKILLTEISRKPHTLAEELSQVRNQLFLKTKKKHSR